MGTRGALGFRIDGADKITYNHFDSYPEGLGQKIVDDLRAALKADRFGEMKTKAAAIRVVTEADTPTDEDIARCEAAGLVDLNVSNQSKRDWYCLLRKAQPTEGGIWGVLDAGAMLDSANFLLDSLFCEYAYIVNLDAMALEVYKGFQNAPHEKGRYAAIDTLLKKRADRGPTSTYYPVALVGELPLATIAKWHKKWQADLFPSDEDEE